MTVDALTDAQWRSFEADGYLRLGRLLDDDGLRVLRERLDAIMLGTADVPYDELLMQLDSSSGAYADAGAQSNGSKGATLAYRKIQGLERDDVFLTYLQHPVFADACRRIYGAVPVATYRSMFMNKPAGGGTELPWHQDRWSWLDRDPLLTAYTAIDAATLETGCVELALGTHGSVINPSDPSAFLTDAQADEHGLDDVAMPLELDAGEVVLLHNWLAHRSGVNGSRGPRRAFSVCYMDARTIDPLESHCVVFDADGRAIA